MFLIVSMMRYK